MKSFMIIAVIVTLVFDGISALYAKEGVSGTTITLGSVLALKGSAKGLGNGMKDGLEAALQGKVVKGRRIHMLFENDFYEPNKARKATGKLIDRGVFLMVGNVGTPTAIVTLPMLRQHNVPAVGFFTGAGILRPGDGGPIANYRASYVQETAAVIDAALANGIKTTEVCAYVQNDGYGMAGLTGIRLAMKRGKAGNKIINAYNRLLAMAGNNPPRNNVGPVGVYRRNTVNVNKGYTSLKNWEKKTGSRCKLVVTVGAYGNIAHFARNATRKGERWIISAVSFTGANNFMRDLKKYKSNQKIIMTQVVPLLDSNLPIVREAKRNLGSKFGFVSLEGYIVGKMTLKILESMQGKLTRENFMLQVRKSTFDLGGIKVDFTENHYQGSNLVIPSYLTSSGYKKLTNRVWQSLLLE